MEGAGEEEDGRRKLKDSWICQENGGKRRETEESEEGERCCDGQSARCCEQISCFPLVFEISDV